MISDVINVIFLFAFICVPVLTTIVFDNNYHYHHNKFSFGGLSINYMEYNSECISQTPKDVQFLHPSGRIGKTLLGEVDYGQETNRATDAVA